MFAVVVLAPVPPPHCMADSTSNNNLAAVATVKRTAQREMEESYNSDNSDTIFQV